MIFAHYGVEVVISQHKENMGMGYKIAIATSDGIHIDLHFGQTESFAIYEVCEDDSYKQIETRTVIAQKSIILPQQKTGCGGCGGGKSKNERIELIKDCRCVLCARCGAGTEIELGKHHITSFIIQKKINEALDKIVKYYGGLLERR